MFRRISHIDAPKHSFIRYQRKTNVNNNTMSSRSYINGSYKPKNREKCINKEEPVYRSSLERKAFEILDSHPSVIEWGAEIVTVPYYSSVKGRKSRYIVDLYVKLEDKNHEIQEFLIEIKPSDQCKPPKKGKRKKAMTLNEEVATWVTNTEKWDAAVQYANERGMTFKIMTENNLFT